MKKIVSAILLLALCIGCIAGCAPKEDANLNAAAEYLYTMYKDAKATTDSDYTVVSQVRINDVAYPITWTADKADNVQIVAGENNMTTVKITAGDEDVNYKLTATMKNEDGLEVSVSFDRIIPAKAQVGGTVVLAYPKESKYVTGGHYQYTSSSGTTKYELVISENKADAMALEVVDNGDETVTFKTGEYYLFCDATHVQFVKEQGDNTKFVLEAADTDGGYYIKCAFANYGGKAQYLEVYSGYLTCYGMGSDPSIYVFKLEEATGAAGTVSGLEGSSDNTPAETDPPVDNSNDPAADSTLSIADAITLGASKPHDTYTDNKYYISGTIKEIKNDIYGNMIIVDEAGKEILIYGTYDANGTNHYDAMATKPVAGDTVTVYGIIGQYKDTPQMKNGWITAHTPAAGGNATEPPATEPPATNPPATEAPAATTGASVTYEFSAIEDKGAELDAEKALALFPGAVSATPTKIYAGNGTGGAYPEQGGMLKCGTSKLDGQLVLTFDKKVAKVEITCHDWYTKSDQYPTNKNKVSVNGSEAVLAPYNENGTPDVLTFTLDGSSETVTIDTLARIFIFKITVYFVG